MKEIKIELKYTPEDFARALPLIAQYSFKRKYWKIIIPIGTFMGIIWLIKTMSYETDDMRIFAIIIFALIPSLMVFFAILILDKMSDWTSKVDKISPWLLDRNIRKHFYSSPHLLEQTIINFSDKGIEYSNDSFSETLGWDFFRKAIETESDIFLFFSKNEAQFFPKRALNSEKQKKQLFQLIEQKLGSIAKF